MTTIHSILDEFRDAATSNRDMGDQFERLIAGHPSLHSVYQTRAGQSLAIPSADVPVDFEEVSAKSLDAAALEAAVRVECRRPFDLRRGPVLRLRLYQSQPMLLLLATEN